MVHALLHPESFLVSMGLIIAIACWLATPEHLPWTHLREMRSMPLFKASYFIIIVAFLLVEIYSYLKINSKYYPDTIVLLVAGSICVMLTELCWILFCPERIKQFSSFFEFLDKQLDHHVRAEPHRREMMVNIRLNREIDRNAKKMLGDLRAATISSCNHDPCKDNCFYGKQIEKLHEGCVQRYLEEVWRKNNFNRPYGRFITFFFFVVGISLILFMLCYRIKLIYEFVSNQHVS